MRSRLKISGKFEAVLSSTLNYQPPTASCTTLRHFAPPRSDFERPLPFLRGLCVKSFCLPWKFHPQFPLRSNGQFDQIRPNSTKKYFCCVRNLGWNFHHRDHFCWAIPDFQSLLYRRALQERPDSAAGDDCGCEIFRFFHIERRLRWASASNACPLLTDEVSKCSRRCNWRVYSGRELRRIDSVKDPSEISIFPTEA